MRVAVSDVVESGAIARPQAECWLEIRIKGGGGGLARGAGLPQCLIIKDIVLNHSIFKIIL